MKKTLFVALLMVLLVAGPAARPSAKAAPARLGGAMQLWQRIDTAGAKSALGPANVPVRKGFFEVFSLDEGLLQATLAAAPQEFATFARTEDYQLAIPMPDGSLQNFRIWESPIMEPALAAEHPEIRTFIGQGVDDPTATARIDRTPLGFHAQIISTNGTVYVDPYRGGDTTTYISYNKQGLRLAGRQFQCLVDDAVGALGPELDKNGDGRVAAYSNGGTVRTYRLALACTGEYATAVCNHNGVSVTVANTFAAMTTTMNRVNGVYERDLSIHMNLVANDTSIVFTNASTDPYTNTNPNSLLTQNQSTCDSNIGSANYDIGHVFSTGGGGLAGLGVVCSASRKAQGETGSSAPYGDGYDIDYVAHEMGHEFGGNHTFISSQGSCSGNGNASTAYERGSGSTIMAYAGICGTDDLQPHSDDYFHTINLNEITAYVAGGGNCSVNTSNGNSIPSLPALTSYTGVPVSTTFTLTAPVATDANGDTLTYCWEDWQTGSACNFRPKAPTTSRSRTFDNVANATSGNIAWEVLPTSAVTKTFRCTVRDNHAGGGAFTSATMTVAFVAGAFSVTAPNTAVSWTGNSTQTVTWAKGGSTAANVKISLSTDGGANYTTVVASTANDGSEAITVPNTPSTTCRIRVEPTDNVYFDVSNVNFTITAGGSCTYSISPTSASPAASASTGSVGVTATAGCSWTASANNTWLHITSGASGTGNGTVGYSVDANSGAARTGTLTIAGQTFTVNQAAAASCSYSISPTSASAAASASTGSVSVTAGAGCSWTASSNSAFLTITSGASGAGNGTVGYSVAANTGAARSGSLTIAGQTFTVNQAAGTTGCSSDNAAITVNAAATSASLATTDCTSTIRTGGRYYDNFSFSATAGTAYTITMNSSAFDTYLHLLSGGTSVAFDDDGNGGTNSKITYTPSASGTLTIHCTSYSASATGAYTVQVTAAAGQVTVLSENAETGAAGWAVTTNTTGNNWVISSAGLHAGANGFRSNNATATYPNNLDQSLISPAFSLSGKTSASLTYFYKQQTETSYDYLRVEVSTNGGSTWTSLSAVSTTSTGFTTTQGAGMVSKTISLTSYAGQANVKIRFRLTSDVSVVYWGAAIDDIAVTAQ